ncbi:hypothetical protein O4G98_15180 [Zoogloeaceae bacterium G21618-S1]|nr:hypothetical protein [Zoogloeaceae bacterium G21618-S1]
MNTKTIIAGIVATLALAGFAGTASADGEYGIKHFATPNADMVQAAAAQRAEPSMVELNSSHGSYLPGR